jgi:hypothetical protein
MSALGRLVASVILDHAEFVGGTEKAKQAAASMATDIDRSLKQVEGSVKTTLGGIAAAFAAGFGVAALKEAFDQYTKNAAALNDLALKAGTTVQWMSSIGPVAKLSATSLDEITSAAEKLSKGIVNGLTKETAAANKALDFLGVSAKDSSGKLKDSGTLIDEIAIKLDAFQDGTSKTTLAIDLFGKAGANMLPFLKDLAEYGERDAKVTQQQALLAKQYEQDLVRLTIAKDALFRKISQELLPVADAFVRALLEMQKGAGGVKGAVDSLASSGGIRDFAMSGVRAIGLILDAGDSVMRLFQTIGEVIGMVVARITNSVGASADAVIHFIRGDYAQAWDDLKQGTIRDAAIVADAGARIRTIFEKPLAGDSFVANVEDKLSGIESAANKAAESAKKLADGYKTDTDAAKAHGDAVDALTKSLDVQAARMQVEIDHINKYGIATKETNVATTEAKIKSLEESGALETAAKLRHMSIDELKEEIRQRAAKVDALTGELDITKEYIDSVKKLNDAAAASVEAVVQQTRVENDKIATFGMSADQVTRYTVKQLEAKKAIADSTPGAEQYAKTLQLLIDKTKDLADTQGRYLDLERQAKLWGDLSDRAGKFFGDLVVNGRSAFDRMRQDLKSLAEDVIAFFAKRFVLSMVAGVAGGGSLAANAAGSVLGGMGNSAVGSLLGGSSTGMFGSVISGAGTGIGGAFGTGALTAGGDFVGTGLAGLAGNAALAAGATDAFAASVAAAVPVIGWIVAIGMILYAIFGKSGGGPKTGGSFLGSFDNAGALTGNLTSGLDRSRYLHDETAQDQDAQRVGTVIGQGIANTVRGLGGSFTGQVGIGWNMDPRGDAQSMVSSLLRDSAGHDLLVQANRNVGRKPEEVQAEIELQTKRTLLAALQNSGLAEYLAQVFRGVDAGTASAAKVDDLVNTAVALKQVFDVASRNPFEDLASAIDASQHQFENTLKNNESAIRNVMKAYDGSSAAAQNLATATNAYYNSQLQLLAGLANARIAIDDMFSGTIRGIQLSVLDKQGQYNFYQSEASDLKAQALASNDPAAIQRYAQQIAQDIAAAFSTLSPEEQRAQAADFIRQEKEAQAALDARLETLQKDAADATLKVLNDMKTIIGAGADAQTAAANTLVQAANTLAAAASGANANSEAIGAGLNAIANKLDALAQDIRR